MDIGTETKLAMNGSVTYCEYGGPAGGWAVDYVIWSTSHPAFTDLGHSATLTSLVLWMPIWQNGHIKIITPNPPPSHRFPDMTFFMISGNPPFSFGWYLEDYDSSSLQPPIQINIHSTMQSCDSTSSWSNKRRQTSMQSDRHVRVWHPVLRARPISELSIDIEGLVPIAHLPLWTPATSPTCPC